MLVEDDERAWNEQRASAQMTFFSSFSLSRFAIAHSLGVEDDDSDFGVSAVVDVVSDVALDVD